MVMNTFLLINPNNAEPKSQPSSAQKNLSANDLMNYFSTNRFQDILPQRYNMDFNFKSMLFPFEKEQIIELLHQMDIFIQLLTQNFLFSSSKETKLKSYDLLTKIHHKKCAIVSFLEYTPIFDVPLSKFKLEHPINKANDDALAQLVNLRSLSIFTKPQISTLQSPLLEFLYLFTEIANKGYSKEVIREILLYLEPFIQKNWVPLINDWKNGQKCARTKFNKIDETLLLIGLEKYGAKSLELINQNYLPEKKVPEIKHRYKNLICSRAADNKIRRWKVLQLAPLTEEEKRKLQKAFDWFESVDKYHLVCRYFLTDRSPEFLQAELAKSENLLKKRKKYANTLAATMIEEDPPRPLYEILTMETYPNKNQSNCEEDQMEIERDQQDQEGDLSEESFEQILNHSHDKIPGSHNKMVLEEDCLNRNPILHTEEDGNFETEELNFSNDESTSSDDSFMRFTQGGKILNPMQYTFFKKIGSQIFEYEEI